MIDVTDEMCRRALAAVPENVVQGFSSPQDEMRRTWGPPHWVEVKGVEVWRGMDDEEMLERCRIEEMRLALHAALTATNREGT